MALPCIVAVASAIPNPAQPPAHLNYQPTRTNARTGARSGGAKFGVPPRQVKPRAKPDRHTPAAAHREGWAWIGMKVGHEGKAWVGPDRHGGRA